MGKRRAIVTTLVVLLGIGGMVAGIFLLQERTNLRQRAAVEGGRATLSLDPAVGTYAVGQTIPMQVKFNTDGLAIKGIRVKLIYSGATPGVSVANGDIQLNNAIFGTTGWVCTTVEAAVAGQNVEVDIQCATTSLTGFSNNDDDLLATVNMRVDSVPLVNPFQVSFNPALSVFTALNNQDILGTPETVASFTISGTGGGGIAPTNTPTPTSTPTPTPTPTGVVSTPTPTPTGVVSTPTPTPIQELPDTGFSVPTLMGIGFGVLLLLGAMILAI